ncbi:MAG: hypothetical protein ACYTEQ_10455 [Planctomycetota bacterium]
MDDVDSRDFETKDFGSEDLDDMVVYGDISAVSPEIKPIPFDEDETSNTEVSHSPLNLGSSGTAEISESRAVARPRGKLTSSPERISGVRTFFAKLHPGAIEFLDEQITNWLRSNPGLVVKRTNMTTGDVQAKKTEPNIIITVWY